MKNCLLDMGNNKFILALCLLLASCATDVDYSYSTTIVFENNSSHEVSVVADNNCLMFSDFTLSPGKTAEFNASGMDDVCPPLEISLLPHEAFVWFGDDVVVRNRYEDSKMPHNICRAASYRTIQKEKRNQKYRYTFTDEDYEYALANPVDKYLVKSEWIFKNNSSSDIIILLGDWHNIEEYNDRNSFTISSGRDYKINYDYYVDVDANSKYKSLLSVCSVVANGTPHLVNANESISCVENYDIEELSRNNLRYTYTFTDEILEQLQN